MLKHKVEQECDENRANGRPVTEQRRVQAHSVHPSRLTPDGKCGAISCAPVAARPEFFRLSHVAEEAHQLERLTLGLSAGCRLVDPWIV
jgi:hypothetical protein